MSWSGWFVLVGLGGGRSGGVGWWGKCGGRLSFGDGRYGIGCGGGGRRILIL